MIYYFLLYNVKEVQDIPFEHTCSVNRQINKVAWNTEVVILIFKLKLVNATSGFLAGAGKRCRI